MDPFILTKFIQATPEGDGDPIVSLVIFEWKDEDLVGVWPSEGAPKVGMDALCCQRILLIHTACSERIHLR